jgi:DNA-binding MarR family transcriptional regulator
MPSGCFGCGSRHGSENALANYIVGLYNWHVQTLPVADLEALVLRLSTLTTRRDGISRTAAATLARLQSSGPTRLTELAVAEGVTQASMSALVARLVDQCLVRRDGDPRDARVVLLSLTPAGEDVVAQRRAARAERLARAMDDLDPGDTARIADAFPALTRLADALRRSSDTTHTEVNR